MINKHKLKIIFLATVYFAMRSSRYYFDNDPDEFGNSTYLGVKILNDI